MLIDRQFLKKVKHEDVVVDLGAGTGLLSIKPQCGHNSMDIEKVYGTGDCLRSFMVLNRSVMWNLPLESTIRASVFGK